jgi:Pentapeptide repeats (8 copies)
MTPSHQFPRIPRRSWRGQNLSGTDFRGINLSGVDFTEAILDGADLSYADLRGTIFRRCSLVGANLQFSRSGIAPQQSILLRSILLILSLLIGAASGFVGSSTTGLLINESKVFAPYTGVDFVVSWGVVA